MPSGPGSPGAALFLECGGLLALSLEGPPLFCSWGAILVRDRNHLSPGIDASGVLFPAVRFIIYRLTPTSDFIYSLPAQSFPIQPKIYLDKYCTSAVTWGLIVGDHLRRFTSSPRSLCALRVCTLGCSFSFVFFVFQLLTFNFQPSLPSNSFPHNSLSDPHPLNPVVSILYKNSGGRGCRFFRLSAFAHSLEQACSKQNTGPDRIVS